MGKKRFGVIGSLGSPLLGEGISTLLDREIVPDCVIIDGELSQKDRGIVASRLDPSFRVKELHELSLTQVPVFFVLNHNSPESVALCRDRNLSYLVNFGTKRIIHAELIACVDGILNAHPGILPKYRGCTAVEWSIHNGDSLGATVHLMTVGIDEGPILFTRSMKVDAFEAYESVRTRMVYHQISCLSDALERVTAPSHTKADFREQAKGTYHKPIPLDLLLAAKRKLSSGDYVSVGEDI